MPEREVDPDLAAELLSTQEYTNMERKLMFPTRLLGLNDWIRQNPPLIYPAGFEQMRHRVTEIRPSTRRFNKDENLYFALLRQVRLTVIELEKIGQSEEEILAHLEPLFKPQQPPQDLR